MRTFSHIAAVAGLVGLLGVVAATAAHAVPVFVDDFSFENQNAGAGGFCFGACLGGAWSGSNVGGILDASIIDISGPGDLPSPLPDGNKTVFDNQPNAGPSQVLAHTLLANTRYTLQVEAAFWLNNPMAQFPELRLQSGDTDELIGSVPVVATAAEWLTQTLVVDIGDVHALLGDPLKIFLSSGCAPGCPPGTREQQIWWDNVRLDASPLNSDPPDIPEPGTLGLFAIGLAGLGVMSRRRRESPRPR